MRPLPFDPITRLNPVRVSDLNRVFEAARQGASLTGPGIVAATGAGLTSVPPERFGLVLARITERSAGAPYYYGWARADVDSELAVADREANVVGGYQAADGSWQTPAVDPTGNHPRALDEIVWLQWDEASRFWLIVNRGAPTGEKVVLKLQSWSSGTPNLSYGYPARVQKWNPALRSGTGWWEDANTTTVYVKDPNDAMPRPGELVEAVLVGAPLGSFDQYSRTGLDGLIISAAGSGATNSSESGASLGVRTVTLPAPFHVDPAPIVPVAGQSAIYLDGSTRQTPGILLGWNSFLTDPAQPPYQQATAQWARGGFTGFDTLGTQICYFSTNGIPSGGAGEASRHWSAYGDWLAGSGYAGMVPPILNNNGESSAMAVGLRGSVANMRFQGTSVYIGNDTSNYGYTSRFHKYTALEERYAPPSVGHGESRDWGTVRALGFMAGGDITQDRLRAGFNEWQLQIGANGGFHFSGVKGNYLSTTGDPGWEVQLGASGPAVVFGTPLYLGAGIRNHVRFRGYLQSQNDGSLPAGTPPWVTGATLVEGNQVRFYNGLFVSLPNSMGGGTIGVGGGGTGVTSLPTGQILAGKGADPVDSLADTRASGESLEVKIGTNLWLGFSSGSY